MRAGPNKTYRKLCGGVPSVIFAKYSVSALSRVSVMVPALLRLRALSWLRGLTLFLSTPRLTTRGEDDRGASEIAETPLAESRAMVTDKSSRAFMLSTHNLQTKRKVVEESCLL